MKKEKKRKKKKDWEGRGFEIKNKDHVWEVEEGKLEFRKGN